MEDFAVSQHLLRAVSEKASPHTSFGELFWQAHFPRIICLKRDLAVLSFENQILQFRTEMEDLLKEADPSIWREMSIVLDSTILSPPYLPKLINKGSD